MKQLTMINEVEAEVEVEDEDEALEGALAVLNNVKVRIRKHLEEPGLQGADGRVMVG